MRNSTMRPTGIRSLIDRCLLVAALMLAATSADALDLFTLWQRQELPLTLDEGIRVDYRRQSVSRGRRVDDLIRVQCVGRDDHGNWLLEVLPLVEIAPDSLLVVPGEGLLLCLTPEVAGRRGRLSAAVADVHLWRDGQVTRLAEDEWRRDPLVTASFSGDFEPDTVREQPSTVRVIGPHELMCRQLEFAAADTQRATLPAGVMVQVSSQEVVAAVNAEIPLLGLAFVTERVRGRIPSGPAQRPVRPASTPVAGGDPGVSRFRSGCPAGARPTHTGLKNTASRGIIPTCNRMS